MVTVAHLLYDVPSESYMHVSQPISVLRMMFAVSAVLLCTSPQGKSAPPPNTRTFDQQVRPLLNKYCVRCHAGDEAKAGIGLQTIDPDIVTGADFDKWEDIREAFNSGEMPPADEPQPTAIERERMTDWLDAEFRKALQHGSTIKRGRVRRLTRYELQYALEDLLSSSAARHVSGLPEEATSVETGLKNNSQLLMISGPHLESYLNVILAVIDELKQVTTWTPYRVVTDVEHLNVNPPKTFADKGRPNKPPVAKVERTGKTVRLSAGGYIDLQIPAVSRYAFDTTVRVKADGEAAIRLSIGFQRSDVDPRQVVHTLATVPLTASPQFQSHTVQSWPDELPTEMSRAIDRRFFVRVANASRRPVDLEAFEYLGNNNIALTSALLPSDIANDEIPQHAKRKIAAFLRTAFRRPPSDAELRKYVAIYRQRAESEPPMAALLSTWQAILCSPGFFYMGMPAERPEDVAASFRLAERLAFFLWCSVPDEELLALAEAGTLSHPEILSAQVDRMLADKKSRRFIEHFTDQWLQTAMLFNVAVDRTYYPRFRDSLKDLMRQETVEAVNDVFRNGATALDFLDCDHVFVNQTLAGFYQLRGVRGSEFRKVRVTADNHRGGLLTQGTFLVGNSDGMNSHAILRGVWLTSILLNDPPPDPPANVPPLDESIPGFDKMTLNEKLFAHRNNAACNSCHRRIDPWGIAFENYDASGAWREKVLVVSKVTGKRPKVKGKKRAPAFEKSFLPVAREATLPDGATVDGIDSLKTHLMTARRDDFARGLTERLLASALSRDLEYHDTQLVDQLAEDFKNSNYRVPDLIRAIVSSEQFQRGY